MSNLSENTRKMNRFRLELAKALGDISEIDKQILDKATQRGVAFAKRSSPVITGNFRKHWKTTPTVKKATVMEKEIVNSAEYASYVNYGHRTVDRAGNTTGYVKSKVGDHLLERTVAFVEKNMKNQFKHEIQEIKKKHDL